MQLNCDKLYRNSVALAAYPLSLMSHSHSSHSAHPVAQPTSGHEHAHVAGDTHTAHNNPAPGHLAESPHSISPNTRDLTGSVLGWPAWQRVLAVLPVLLLLWLAVAWASREVQPW
jgi:hypothetical protein